MTKQEATEYCLLRAEQHGIDYNEVLQSYDLRMQLSLRSDDQLTEEVVDDIFQELFC